MPFCVICIDDQDPDQVELPCSHFFCRACLTEWSKQQQNCPLCKSDHPWLKEALGVESDEEEESDEEDESDEEEEEIYERRPHAFEVPNQQEIARMERRYGIRDIMPLFVTDKLQVKGVPFELFYTLPPLRAHDCSQEKYDLCIEALKAELMKIREHTKQQENPPLDFRHLIRGPAPPLVSHVANPFKTKRLQENFTASHFFLQ